MNKTSSFLIGTLIGVASSAAIYFLLGPARDAEYDERYRSRLGWAMDLGDKAAAARETELRRKFEEAKQPRQPDDELGSDNAMPMSSEG